MPADDESKPARAPLFRSIGENGNRKGSVDALDMPMTLTSLKDFMHPRPLEFRAATKQSPASQSVPSRGRRLRPSRKTQSSTLSPLSERRVLTKVPTLERDPNYKTPSQKMRETLSKRRLQNAVKAVTANLKLAQKTGTANLKLSDLVSAMGGAAVDSRACDEVSDSGTDSSSASERSRDGNSRPRRANEAEARPVKTPAGFQTRIPRRQSDEMLGNRRRSKFIHRT
jgi:hypothetical protein